MELVNDRSSSAKLEFPESSIVQKRMKSIVGMFDCQKGFGFIKNPNQHKDSRDKRDIFVHYTQILDEENQVLFSNEPVEFDLVVTDRGPQAINVDPVARVKMEDIIRATK